MRTFYVIGVPGSGKSTFVRHVLTEVYDATIPEQLRMPVPHVRYRTSTHGVLTAVMQIGVERPTFSGTDALAMNINPRACEWVASLTASGHLFGEGDRLANNRFLDACPNLTLIHLDVPLEVAKGRAEARAKALGVPAQNDTWWKGRATKTANLLKRPHVSFDGTKHPNELVADFRSLLRAAPA